MEKSKFKIILIPTLFLTSFLLILFFLSITSSAASTEVNDYIIPYSIPEFYINNGLTTEYAGWDNLVTRLKSVYSDQIENPSNFDWDNYIAFPIETSDQYKGIQYKILFNPTITYDVPNDLNFYQNSVTISFSRYIIFRVYFDVGAVDFGYNFYFSDTSRGNSGTNTIFSNFDPYEFYNGYYVQRYYPFILVGNDILDTNGDVILTNTAPSGPINTGSAVEPDHYDKTQTHHQGHSRPGQVPIPPTYNTYTWNTYNAPSIDTSTLENLVASLFNLVKYNGEYLGTNFSGLINTFMSNVKLSFEYIGDSLDYHLGLIIDNIQNFMDNFYDNMASLFEPFFANFKGFFEMLFFVYENGLNSNGSWSLGTFVHFLFIPDPDELSDLLVSHDIYDVIGLAETTQTNMNTIKSMITGGSDLYKITISQFSIMGVSLGPYDIDFSWYLSLKSVGDPIISAFLIFGYFLWLHARLPYWLRGQQGDIVGFAKEVQK